MSEVPLCRCESPYYVDQGRLKVKETHRFSSPLSFGTTPFSAKRCYPLALPRGAPSADALSKVPLEKRAHNLRGQPLRGGLIT